MLLQCDASGGSQLEDTFAVRDAEIIRGLVKFAPDFLIALPDRVAFLVPGKLVAVDQAARRDAGDDDPVEEVVAAAEPQAPGRLPVGPAAGN